MQYNIDRLSLDKCGNSVRPLMQIVARSKIHLSQQKSLIRKRKAIKSMSSVFIKRDLNEENQKFGNRLKILDNIRFLLHQDISIQYPIWFGCPHDKEFQIFSLNAEPQCTSNHESFCLVFRYEFNLIDIYI